MFISDAHRFVFITTPKCGSHTMKKVLVEHYGAREGVAFHWTKVPSECADYFVFTCVRNPYTRAWSLWWRCVVQQDPYDWRAVIGLKSYEEAASPQGFRRFIEALTSCQLRDRGKAPYMGKTQSEWLEGVKLDGFLRIETMAQDFADLPFVERPLSFSWPHVNQSTGARPDALALYDRTAFVSLMDWAQEDFDRFGYDLPDYATHQRHRLQNGDYIQFCRSCERPRRHVVAESCPADHKERPCLYCKSGLHVRCRECDQLRVLWALTLEEIKALAEPWD